jgi:hypothetical protein
MITGDSRMSNPETNDQKGAARPSPRRPYVKPAFCSEPVFEIKALSCIKLTAVCEHGSASTS